MINVIKDFPSAFPPFPAQHRPSEDVDPLRKMPPEASLPFPSLNNNNNNNNNNNS